MIHFRKKHTVIRKNMPVCSAGFPTVSLHEAEAWNGNYNWDSHVIGVMYAGKDEESDQDGYRIFIHQHLLGNRYAAPAAASCNYAVDNRRRHVPHTQRFRNPCKSAE